jgi:hypothetical protein
MYLRYIDYSLNILKQYVDHYSDTPGFGSLNFPLVLLSLGILTVSFLLGKKLLERKPSFKHYDPNDYPEKLKGINGLLILAKAVLMLVIIINCVNFYNSLFLYGTNAWDFLTSESQKYPGELWPFTIIYITATNFFLLLYSFFLIIVAFKKKRIFKFIVMVFLYLNLFISAFKYFMLSQVFEASHEIVYHSFLYLSFLTQLSIVISAYMAFSRRVNATFSK